MQGTAQRLALPAAGGTRLAHETDSTQSHDKGQFSGENPAVRVHALLGGKIHYRTAHDYGRLEGGQFLTTISSKKWDKKVIKVQV